MNKKPFRLASLGWLLLMLMAACGTQTATPEPPAATAAPVVAETEPETETVAETAAYPLTLSHKFGQTTIPAQPQRILSLGYNEQDIFFALGLKPVAVRYWYGEAPHGIFPWAEDKAQGATPELLNMAYGELNYEAILALEPDFISAVYSGITAEEYEQLSLIAPTLAQSADYIEYGTPWQETTTLVGQAVGYPTESAELVAAVEGQFAQARAENPAFAGKSVAVVYNYGGNYGFYTAQDGRGRFFSELGFEIPQELVEMAGESFYADVSAERLDVLDRDVIVFLGLQYVEGGQEGILSDPLISRLHAVQEGRVVFVPLAVDDALNFGSVLSLEYALEGLLPLLQTAVAGTDQ